MLHKGPYDGIWGAWEPVREWMAANGRQPGGAPPREVYLNDPREFAEEELLTGLIMPLA